MTEQDRQIVDGVIFPVEEGEQEDLILNLIRIVKRLDAENKKLKAEHLQVFGLNHVHRS